jgi:hypothetical protein
MQSLDTVTDPSIVALAAKARAFLERFKWCRAVRAGELGFAATEPFGFGVFRFTIEPTQANVPPIIWIVDGDLPAQYIAGPESWRDALQAYVTMVSRWLDAVRAGGDGKGILPVSYDITPETAADLTEQIAHLRDVLAGRTPAPSTTHDQMSFSSDVGQELFRMLGQRAEQQLAGMQAMDRFTALLAAALIPVAEVLRLPVEHANDPAATADKMVALCSRQLRELLQQAVERR